MHCGIYYVDNISLCSHTPINVYQITTATTN